MLSNRKAQEIADLTPNTQIVTIADEEVGIQYRDIKNIIIGPLEDEFIEHGSAHKTII